MIMPAWYYMGGWDKGLSNMLDEELDKAVLDLQAVQRREPGKFDLQAEIVGLLQFIANIKQERKNDGS